MQQIKNKFKRQLLIFEDIKSGNEKILIDKWTKTLYMIKFGIGIPGV